MEFDELYTVAELCKLENMCKATFYKHFANKLRPYFKGKTKTYSRRELREVMKRSY